MWRRASSLLFLLLVQASAHAQLPPRLEITYEVLRNGSKIAEIVGRLESTADSYRLTESWHGKGIYALLGRAMRTSEGKLSAAGPRPLEFVDERSGRDTARASFDWSANTLTMRYKGRSRTEPIPPNAQDRLSFILALSLAPPGSKTGDYHLVNGRGVSHHVYEFNGRERVQTAAGEFEALKVVRGAPDERTEIWLASAFGGLPVRMLAVEKGGSRWDQVATRIER
jgi:uncharacterized protein DUF3108